MKHLARALMALGLLGAVAAAGAVAAPAIAQADRITICHRTASERNPFVAITISASALEAHLAHGDFFGQGECQGE